MDIAYEGDASLGYAIELSQGGTVVTSAACNPLGRLPVKMGFLEKNLGASHSRSGSGKMVCGTTLPKAGPTLVTATLAVGKRPTSLKLTKADLVLKQ